MTLTKGDQPALISELTDEQRRIVEWGQGPAVVVAGAGTGKTKVIVERVRYLLDTVDGLLPEHFLVLTYNVKAAAELRARIEVAVGVTAAARMTVSNFHSFCQRVLTENAADAGLPARPDVLDGVAQLLLLREIRPQLHLVYHSDRGLADVVRLINRCKDELVTPADFDVFVAEERRVFESQNGRFQTALDRLLLQGNLTPLRKVRGDYASVRANERAEARGEIRDYKADAATKTADREARRTIGVTGYAHSRGYFQPEDHPRIDALAASYVIDGAALEVLRLTELSEMYHAYEAELARRGALDYGEQIAGVTQLFKTRPNVLRRWQRLFRYVLVDEFQDANVAQIELIELLGRTPDRPDNVMVVGDDDQSIYRFRGASFAAFAEFDTRFSKPPAHDPAAIPPGPPPRLRLEQNFRSGAHILVAANRVIGQNETRFEPDKRLVTERGDGAPIELDICAGPSDEAVAIVDAIKSMSGDTRRWGDVAILYRKHKHRDEIVARLRDEDIPYTVVGGLSLFDTPEIRDLEQGLRAIANPQEDAALVRMMSAGPWRLSALEILKITRMANFDRRHPIDAIADIVTSGQVDVDLVGQTNDQGRPAHVEVDVDAPLRAKLRILRAAIDELNPLTYREGPHTILERYLELSGQVYDLIATGTLEAKRTVTNIASFLRFAADWQQANPDGNLARFVDYLDAYKGANGELPTSVELSEDVDGVRLMTVYQAKGLEFPIVIVPHLLDGEWPMREGWAGYFPPELLREAVPEGDVHTDEERRLLYVAMTRAQERLILTTHGGIGGGKAPSRFIGELREGAGAELAVIDRTVGIGAAAVSPDDEFADEHLDAEPDGLAAAVAAVRRVMPMPTARERRLALRLRASELVGLMEATGGEGIEASETDGARRGFEADLAGIGRAAAMSSEVARAQGLDPMTFRSVALDSGAGANLLQVAPLPTWHSFSSFRTYDTCPLQYAFANVYRMPPPDKPVAPFAFGNTAHAAFEAFTKERREAAARGDPPPTREDLEREFRARWVPSQFGDRVSEEGYQRRVATLLDNFWTGEVSTLSEAIAEEQKFELTLEPDDGSAPVIITGYIDRIDRLPSGRVEVIDYKTGNAVGQSVVDKSLQLSIYALACRDALGLGTPERVTLYFMESALRLSTTRTDEQLAMVRTDILERVARMRSGDFTATPGRQCSWCDFRAMCPERAT